MSLWFWAFFGFGFLGFGFLGFGFLGFGFLGFGFFGFGFGFLGFGFFGFLGFGLFGCCCCCFLGGWCLFCVCCGVLAVWVSASVGELLGLLGEGCFGGDVGCGFCEGFGFTFDGGLVGAVGLLAGCCSGCGCVLTWVCSGSSRVAVCRVGVQRR
ncbi:MAG: hypothetical protein H6512_14135 [Acidimicrobiia bacterium]|nr:hypothetical protein [Acidimicrobiia bacterium]